VTTYSVKVSISLRSGWGTCCQSIVIAIGVWERHIAMWRQSSKAAIMRCMILAISLVSEDVRHCRK
jgi:hypothetical protein